MFSGVMKFKTQVSTINQESSGIMFNETSFKNFWILWGCCDIQLAQFPRDSHIVILNVGHVVPSSVHRSTWSRKLLIKHTSGSRKDSFITWNITCCNARYSWCASHQIQINSGSVIYSNLFAVPWYLFFVLATLSVATESNILHQLTPNGSRKRSWTTLNIFALVCDSARGITNRCKLSIFAAALTCTRKSTYGSPLFVAESIAILYAQYCLSIIKVLMCCRLIAVSALA